jgi:hypothetical protein
MNRPNRRPVEMGGGRQGRGLVEGSEARRLCLWMGGGVWKRFGLNWWGIGRGRAVERCDGGGHHGFHAFCEMAFLTISKATEHLGRNLRYGGLPYTCPESPKSRYYTGELSIKSKPCGRESIWRCSINCNDGRWTNLWECFLLEAIWVTKVSLCGVEPKDTVFWVLTN